METQKRESPLQSSLQITHFEEGEVVHKASPSPSSNFNSTEGSSDHVVIKLKMDRSLKGIKLIPC